MKKVEIFTDGACIGNPGPGGYAAILKYEDHIEEISGYEPYTTNNRMELRAAVEALKRLKEPSYVVITTDSRYLIKGITQWIERWIKKGWKTYDKKEVLNRDLWECLYRLCKIHKIEWRWIKGHDGFPENERCDMLAKKAIKEARKKR